MRKVGDLAPKAEPKARIIETEEREANRDQRGRVETSVVM